MVFKYPQNPKICSAHGPGRVTAVTQACRIHQKIPHILDFQRIQQIKTIISYVPRTRMLQSFSDALVSTWSFSDALVN